MKVSKILKTWKKDTVVERERKEKIKYLSLYVFGWKKEKKGTKIFPCLGFKKNGKENNCYLLLYLKIYDLKEK